MTLPFPLALPHHRVNLGSGFVCVTIVPPPCLRVCASIVPPPFLFEVQGNEDCFPCSLARNFVSLLFSVLCLSISSV
ncbi:hypothetical protein DEO72_LG9g1083 [Vigna unguiculata]|uniref:Uncharacterized protein n=1 Tax=Vigna unguiculata TaxID=3917 RepID=A0A4D6MZH6_VIGUN|nr:hypothetical protein DEO72_LG9g1083 [Vigna unguiculata]